MPSLLAEALAVPLEALRERTLAPVDVVVIDSGVDATHPDLAGRVKSAYRVEVTGSQAEVTEHAPTENVDTFGHGTAVASIICRSAPNARIVDVRVIGANNTG